MFGLNSIRNLTASINLIDNVTGPLRSVNRNMDVAKLKMGEFGSILEKNKTSLMALGGAMAAAGGVMVWQLGSTVRASADYEKSMANVSTMVDTTTEDMKLMGSQVLNLSKEIPISAVTMADALYQIRSASVPAGDAIGYLDVSSRAAVAGLTDTVTAVNAVTAVIKGYGMEFSEAEMVSDKMFKTVQLGQTTFGELASSIGGAVPLANALGIEINELMAGYATLTGVTGNTAEVSTQLESIMAGFIKPTTEMEKTVKKLGYANSQAMLSELGLVESLRVLMETTDGSNEALGDLFMRKEGITAVLALLGSQYDTFNSKLGEMENSSGAMSEAYKKNSETFYASSQKMKNSIFALKVSLGDALAPAVEHIADAIGGLANFLDSLPGPIKTAVAVTAGLTAVTLTLGGALLLTGVGITMAIPGIVALSGVLGAAKIATMAFSRALIGMGLALLTNPITWILIGIIGALALLQHAWTHNWGGIQEKTRAVIDWIAGKINWLVEVALNAWEQIKPFWDIAKYLIPGAGQMTLAKDLVTGQVNPRELASSTVSSISKSIGNLEISIGGSDNPQAVADHVLKRIKREFGEI